MTEPGPGDSQPVTEPGAGDSQPVTEPGVGDSQLEAAGLQECLSDPVSPGNTDDKVSEDTKETDIATQ